MAINGEPPLVGILTKFSGDAGFNGEKSPASFRAEASFDPFPVAGERISPLPVGTSGVKGDFWVAGAGRVAVDTPGVLQESSARYHTKE